MQGSIPCLSNSTAKIKHCYGFIAGALSIAGKIVACIEMHHQSGREPNGRTHHIGVLDKSVATKEGAHSTVNYVGLFGADSGKDHLLLQKYLRS